MNEALEEQTGRLLGDIEVESRAEVVRSSGGWPSSRRPSTMLNASRLTESISPVRTSKATTPTGEVLTRVSRSPLARRSSGWVQALAMIRAA